MKKFIFLISIIVISLSSLAFIGVNGESSPAENELAYTQGITHINTFYCMGCGMQEVIECYGYENYVQYPDCCEYCGMIWPVVDKVNITIVDKWWLGQEYHYHDYHCFFLFVIPDPGN